MSRRYLLAGLVAMLSLSCSIREYQREGDVLYTGIRKIDIAPHKGGAEAERALLAAEAQLAYPPNNSLFGSSTTRLPLPLYRPYLHLRYADSETWLGRQLHRIGKKPVWIRDVNPALRAKVTERILGEHGYLAAKVESEVRPSTPDSMQAKVSYQIRLGELYRLDSVAYLPPIALSDSTALRHDSISPLKRGEGYSVDALLNDRNSYAKRLREEGYYYFNPSYISYEVDSLQVRERLQLRTKLAEALPEEALRQWRIGEVRVRFVDAEDGIGQSLKQDTLRLNPRVQALYSGRLPVRPKVLDSRIRLRPDSLYRYSQEDLTIRSLGNLGTFATPEIYYTRRSDSLSRDSLGLMDMTILMRRDKPWAVTLGGQFLHKTTNFVGPSAIVSLGRRNLFGGGETLTLSGSASYEWQIGNNPFTETSSALNSYQLSADASLSFPTLLIPGWLDHYFAYPTTTTFRLSGQRLNRAGYYGLNTISFGMSYDYQPTEYTTHSLKVLGIDYTHLANTTSVFDNILANNPSLSLSLSSQLIPSIGYTYTWTKKLGRKERNTLWIRSSISEAGNITKGLFMIGGSKWGDTQRILGVPYAQFAKLTSELRYNHYIDRNQSLATRVSLGAIYSYGNMSRAPYIEQFFVGGASSIRAFTVRSLGPGAFRNQSNSPYTFMDHVGELKFEANAEFRRKLTRDLELAFFLDMGNVWLLREDAERPRGAITELRSLGDFLNQIAVGTGLGLRYDLSYLLIRLDAGIGLHLPYETERKGWYNVPSFSKGFGLHLAIGYPF